MVPPALLALFFVLPLLWFVPGLSWADVREALGGAGLGRAVATSLASASVATAIAAVVGVPAGYLLAGGGRRSWLAVLRSLVLLPLVLPPVAAGVLLLNLYGPGGFAGRLLSGAGWSLVNAFGGVVLAQTFVAAPFVVLTAEAAFRAVNPLLEEASATLGQSRTATFRRVSLPLARYGVLAGLVLAWMRAVGEFGATVVVAYHPHSLPVYLWLELTGRGLRAALPVALVALVLAAFVLLIAHFLVGRQRVRQLRRPVLRGPGVPRFPAESPEGAPAESPAVPSAEVRPLAAVRPFAEMHRIGERSAAAAQPILEVEVGYASGAFELDVELTARDEIFSLFGPSGAGKTTLLRLIAGLARPDRGRIVLGGKVAFTASAGEEPRWRRPEERPVGLVFQSPALFPHLTARQNILFGAPRGDERAAERLREMLGLTRLRGLEGRYPHELSGGQGQRVALARALMRRPRILLLDEPFSSLDRNMKDRLHADVLRLQRTYGLCVIYVTHDLRDACALGDRLGVLADGRLAQVGAPLEVIRRPASHDVARFVGVRNLLAATVRGRVSTGWVVDAQGLELEVGAGSGEFVPGDRVYVCVRPEDVVLLKPDRPARPPADENVLSGTVVGQRLLGGAVSLAFRVDDAAGDGVMLEVELPVRSVERLGVAVGRRWSISLRRSAMHLVPAPVGGAAP